MSKAIILKIIRYGLNGDKESVKSYTQLLAAKYEKEGDSKFAESLRRYAKEDFGNIVKPAEVQRKICFDERSYEPLDKMIRQGRYPGNPSTCPSDYKEISVTNPETGETRIVVIPKSDAD